MTSRWVGALIGAFGLTAPGTAGCQVPAVISRDWVERRFLAAHGDDAAQLRDWEAVRSRPELFHILREVAADSTVYYLVRANAIFRLGASDQDAAYAWLQDEFRTRPQNDEWRSKAVIALLSGPAPRSATAYRVVGEVLRTGTPLERAETLAGLEYHARADARARSMLESHARFERDPNLRGYAEAILQRLDAPREPPP